MNSSRGSLRGFFQGFLGVSPVIPSEKSPEDTFLQNSLREFLKESSNITFMESPKGDSIKVIFEILKESPEETPSERELLTF